MPSAIEWTDETWNPVTGCTKVSPACAHCYIERTPPFRMAGRKFVKGAIPVVLHPERLTVPLRWKSPKRVFVNSLSDLFHEDVPFEFVDRVFAVMALSPQHVFQVLTKRPERMREYLTSEVEMRLPVPDSPAIMRPRKNRVWLEAQGLANVCRLPMPLSMDWTWPLPNVWLGVSVENQRWADVRIPELLATPAAVRFLSCEPLLGPLDLALKRKSGRGIYYALTGERSRFEGPDGDEYDAGTGPRIDWVIAGGESGPGALRSSDLGWFRSLRDQCRAAGTAFFLKQVGKVPRSAHAEQIVHPDNEGYGVFLGPESRTRLSDRKGGDWEEWPEDLRVREMPR